MPTVSSASLVEKVQLRIGSYAHDGWESYSVDSDLQVPADAWEVSLALPYGKVPDFVVAGAPCKLAVDGEIVMTGRVDELDHNVAKQEHRFNLRGRDDAAVLVDCSAPLFSKQQATLDEIAAAITRDLGITKIQISGGTQRTLNKISVEPGDSAWDALAHAAEANGLWPWFEPDGTLVVGGPDYTTPPVATLILSKDGRGNNVLTLSTRYSVADRYSSVTVLGQRHGTLNEQGLHNISATMQDTGIGWNRPKIVCDYESDSPAIAQSRAKKLIADSRLRGFSMTARVRGHRIRQTDGTLGKLWAPGQRIHVKSEPHGIDNIYFLMGRKFSKSRSEGTITELRLVEDGVWLIEAHPHKRHYRRGKNSLPGEVVDLSGGA